MTESGRNQVEGTGKIAVGSGKLVDPAKLARIFVSPRLRAQQTFELAFEQHKDQLQHDGKVSTTDRLAEWDYGAYEGMVTKDIRALRKSHGLDNKRPWDIWQDGCEEGE